MSTSTLSIAISKKQWSSVIYQVSRNKKKAAVWAKSSRFAEGPLQVELKKNVYGLPIHEAIYLGAPYEVIHALALAYPKGVTEKEMVMNRLPLHLATMQKPMNEHVVSMLMTYSGDAVADPDDDWRTPLHYALENPSGGSDRLIMQMLILKPNVSRAVDKKGYSPLHLACSTGYSTTIIRTLLQLFPEASFFVAERGKSAEQFIILNRASNKYRNTGEVLALLDHYRAEAEEQFRDALEVSSRRYVV